VTASHSSSSPYSREDIPAPGLSAGTALLDAAWAGDARAVEERLAALSESLSIQELGGLASTALSSAARLGHADCVSILLSRAPGSARDAQRSTPLAQAAKNGHARCVVLLMGHNDPNAQDDLGRTALMEAAERGHALCVDLLLSRSSATLQDSAGMDALMLAARRGAKNCVERLLPFSDLSAVDQEGRNALMLSILSQPAGETPQTMEMAHLLFPFFPVMATNQEGHAFADLAAGKGMPNCLALALGSMSKDEVNAARGDGHPLLLIAAKNRHRDCARALLAAGADPSIVADRWDAMLLAVSNNDAPMVELLADHMRGLSRELGKTAFEFALERHWMDCVDAMAPLLNGFEIEEALQECSPKFDMPRLRAVKESRELEAAAGISGVAPHASPDAMRGARVPPPPAKRL